MAEATQSKHPEAQVFQFHQSEALLRNVMENAAVGMVLIGTGGRVIYANRAFAEILGYDPTDLVGFGPENLMHPDYVADAHEQVRRLQGWRG